MGVICVFAFFFLFLLSATHCTRRGLFRLGISINNNNNDDDEDDDDDGDDDSDDDNHYHHNLHHDAMLQCL